MPLIPATAAAAIAHTHGLGAMRPAAADAGMAPHALDHATELARRLGEPVLGGNRALLLHDRSATLAALFKAIDSARDHINIESDIVGADGPSALLADKLIERCRAGVRVNLLVGHGGTPGTEPECMQRLREAGARLCAYKPARRWRSMLSGALHLREHRRLLVVDGRIGFIGGVGHSGTGAADAARSAALPGSAAAPPWGDLHVQLEGPAVRRLQQLFIAHWLRHSRCAMQQARYFPPLAPVGTHRVGVAGCDAGRRRNPHYGALLGAIATARSHVLLTTAYRVPPRRLLRALAQAAQRGVRVELLLPRVDHFWAPLFAARRQRAQLLRTGMLIHERPDTMPRAKACVIDGVWASVGSGNIDARSVVHNAEANLVVVDEGFARQLEQAFRQDAVHAQHVDPFGRAQRSLWHRFKETLTRRFAHPL